MKLWAWARLWLRLRLSCEGDEPEIFAGHRRSRGQMRQTPQIKISQLRIKILSGGKMTWIIKSLRNISLSFLASQQPERAEIIGELEPFLSRYFLPVPGPASGWHPHLSTEQTLQARNNPIIVFISFYGKRLWTHFCRHKRVQNCIKILFSKTGIQKDFSRKLWEKKQACKK